MKSMQITFVVAFVLAMLVLQAKFIKSQVATLTNVLEGGTAFLKFSHTCNSTKVTLRRGNAALIYNSERPTLPTSAIDNIKVKNGSDGETCFLYLTINPVTRGDEGTYLLTAYKNDPPFLEDARILLHVSYPPGKASCSSSEVHDDPDWIRLQCTAPSGSIAGYIMCYQHGVQIPPLASPERENNGALSQTFLANDVGALVYCCSSIRDQTKGICECNDSVWDPVKNNEVYNANGPCSPSRYPATEDIPLAFTSGTSNTKVHTGSTVSPQQNIPREVQLALIVGFSLVGFSLVVVVVGAVYYCRVKRRGSGTSYSDNESGGASFVSQKEDAHPLPLSEPDFLPLLGKRHATGNTCIFYQITINSACATGRQEDLAPNECAIN